MYDIIIIGGGPAGYMAGTYAARGGAKVLILEGPVPGGQLTITTEVENFPGRIATTGPAIVDEMRAQAFHNGAELKVETVTGLDAGFHSSGTKLIETANGQYTAKAVIIATGASAKWLGIPGEDQLKGLGVSACATCDGPMLRMRPGHKKVVVIGGGDTAMEEALYLANIADEVVLVHRRHDFRASAVMVERAKAHPKIQMVLGYKPIAFKAGESGMLARVELTGSVTRDVKYIENVMMAFVAIGHQPATAFLREAVELDEAGYIVRMPGTHQVQRHGGDIIDLNYNNRVVYGIPGVFAAGDCTDKVYRQAATAAGMGCAAALEALRYLEAEAHKAHKAATAGPVVWEQTHE